MDMAGRILRLQVRDKLLEREIVHKTKSYPSALTEAAWSVPIVHR